MREDDSALLQLEMEKLKNSVKDLNTKHSNNKSLKWSDFKTKPGSKALILGTIFALLTVLTGCSALNSYAATFFKESGSSFSPNMSAIFLGVIHIFGCATIIFLVDRAGRKV